MSSGSSELSVGSSTKQASVSRERGLGSETQGLCLGLGKEWQSLWISSEGWGGWGGLGLKEGGMRRDSAS